MSGEKAMDWLTNVRGLDAELLARMGVDGFTRGDGTELVRFRYFRSGQVYGGKIRTIDGKDFWFQPKGAPRSLYNVDILNDTTLRSQPVIVTEGEIDCISVIQAGFPRTVSVPDGWTEGLEGGDGAKMKQLMEVESKLRESPCVIIAGDMDQPGTSLARAVRNLLEGHPVRWVRWPHDCKDANDVLRKHEEPEIVRGINAARLMDPDGCLVTGFSDMPPMSERKIMRCDIPVIDSGAVFEVGQLSVMTGVPSSGKSTLAVFMAHHLIRNEGIKVGAALFETHPAELRNHLALLNHGARWSDMGPVDRRKLELKLDGCWRLIFRDERDGARVNIPWVEKMIHTVAVRDGCKLIIVDPWNEMEHLPEPGESMTNYINFALTRIRQLAERYDCHIMVVAHPSKHRDMSQAPTGYSVADSAAFFNKPALGLTVHPRDDAVELVTWKVKFRQTYGIHPGTRRLDFDQDRMVYRKAR